MKILPVIMSGGAGTRLWPLSRTLYPKQFLAISGRETLFQQAIGRLIGIAAPGSDLLPPCIVANDEHRFLCLDQIREMKLSKSSIILEPIGRNTAPALTLAALYARDELSQVDPILVVAPADQMILDVQMFTQSISKAVEVAADGDIVILGIKPDRPETGYGYIHSTDAAEVKRVDAFVEKPGLQTAQKYLDEGSYFWNSGIFVLRASVWLKALKIFREDIFLATEKAWAERAQDSGFIRPQADAFSLVPSESIDYAVIEHCAKHPELQLKMLTMDAGWSDLGAWDAVWRSSEKDDSHNATHGDVIVESSANTLVYASHRLVTAVGLDNIVIVETPDAVLVANKERSQGVKAIVEALNVCSRSETKLHRRVHRPWGWYDSIDSGSRFQVKRILVKPKATLSLQKHYHRAEHWIVVSGTAEVTCEDRIFQLNENQSTYIPVGHVHRLSNPGTIPLEIIEVQSGSYLGEDDIVRFDDTYGRV
ncbi:mannose-1-phosphate guanylyltransferase/mannose-6-phosphate isomerase [Pseudomonas chlororaphis]|jgi:mannose-1-phosphate guanylyltransferase/mannose-6-phosphate isomerase|uniref:mannose-1-phosphate guanylyltransferase/mannose-6-phosphate isomerase n=1 Tax=Pseudomonas chlororaphis TaxID=587753 RepID=UPI00026E5161|nr:mannose-1-phosphate guanylyltransferase/mannose-6-phosphate isomerase [Pseudomonas chlororaphis]AZD17186.1 Mannose-1-phosphate guanylyltransferase [Pseudomonas chlororaphis]EJL00135.1 mannose-1-phosphate guanylyltransferase/mannose-6-phosphate isomerase [Pseudomonas chlororaphis subsp. aureofaciens 30-84]WDH45767.1 mannose-1-phosphate guanylyltransferase/mannose-6-phosphate isomerase [Pseudomonas chlororaphis]WDH57614.1 mannose-1-phosphate guanylyltransferase/mannose-6-phosphate isomerase [P